MVCAEPRSWSISYKFEKQTFVLQYHSCFLFSFLFLSFQFLSVTLNLKQAFSIKKEKLASKGIQIIEFIKINFLSSPKPLVCVYACVECCLKSINKISLRIKSKFHMITRDIYLSESLETLSTSEKVLKIPQDFFFLNNDIISNYI